MAKPASAPGAPASSPILGRHYRTGAAIAVHHANGRLTSIAPQAATSNDLPWVAPPLVDLQVNGFAGVDFQQDHVSLSGLEHACQGLLAAGCGRILLTLITDEWFRMLEKLRHLRALRQQSSTLEAMIAGWHIEGPFLSAEPGFHGAHPPEFMLDPTPDHVHALHEIVGNDPLLLTLAPERAGAPEAIREAVARGFRVSLGHTNATSGQLSEAVRAGAQGFTHLGNACPKLLDRHDNILWRVLDLSREMAPTPRSVPPESVAQADPPTDFGVSLIPDGLHLPPVLFRVLHAAAGFSKVFYVSDAMAGAGAPPGPATLGPLELQVGPDGVVRQPGRDNFAGSALRPIEGVFRAATMLGGPWAECWDRFSLQPAGWMGWFQNALEMGAPADLCLFELPETPSGSLGPFTGSGRVRRVLLAGQEVYRGGSDG